MAVYQVNKIQKDVRIVLDQNMTSDALTALQDTETLSLDELIESKVVEAVRRVHNEAPLDKLNQGHNFGDALYWRGADTCGWTLLPDDFMRLIVFMMDDWDRAVYKPLHIDNPKYYKQASRFKGIRGTPQHPKCAIAIRPEGKVLEFYSCKSQESKVSRAVYIPYPKIDQYGGIEISNQCYEAVIYVIASLVSATIGEADKVKLFNELAQSLLV